MHTQGQNQAENSGKLREASSIINSCSPSREDPVLQAGRLAAPPTPLVTAGTAFVERGARRWKRSDEQTAKRCCSNEIEKYINLSRRKECLENYTSNQTVPLNIPWCCSQSAFSFAYLCFSSENNMSITTLASYTSAARVEQSCSFI